MIDSPADKLLDCATLIKTWFKDSNGTYHSSMATGFLLDFAIEEQRVPVLVSNRHVLKNFDRLEIHLRVSSHQNWIEQLNSFIRTTVCIERSNCNVFLHPNPAIDLAILPMAPVHRQTQSQNQYVANFHLQENMIMSENDYQKLSAIENLVMIGCPQGIYDTFNNLPIVRRGITASHPAHHFNGELVFLSDIACFPGSSGSPIFLYDPFGYPDYENHSYIWGNSRIKLLGIQSRAYSNTETKQFINLAIVQKSYLLLDFKPIILPFL